MRYEELPESVRNELYAIFCFKTTSTDMILNTLMRLSRDLPGYHDPKEIFEVAKEYLVENKMRISENMKQFEKTVNWDRTEE